MRIHQIGSGLPFPSDQGKLGYPSYRVFLFFEIELCARKQMGSIPLELKGVSNGFGNFGRSMFESEAR